MPNDPYLDASVAWRIKSGNIEFREADYRTTVGSIIDAGLATEVLGLISSGKEADVYLAGYKGAPIAVKVYRLYRTSHRGGRPIKLDSAGWLAAHEYDMLHQAWKGGANVPTPARRVENMFSMRYLGGAEGPAPRLHEVELRDPRRFLEKTMSGLEKLASAGVIHSDLSAFNILVLEDEPWFIDLSEGIRVDRVGYSAWKRFGEARQALENGLRAFGLYFRKYDITIDVEGSAEGILRSVDRYGRCPMS
jgi:serine/threonine-protein kinase RIO1